MQERRLKTEIEVENKENMSEKMVERKRKLTILLAIPSPIEFPTIPYGESIVFTSSSYEMKKERNQKMKREKEKETRGDSRSIKDHIQRKVKVLI